MSGKTACPSEKTERGDLAQHIIGDHRRRLLDFLLADHRSAGRHVSHLLLAACHDTDGFLCEPCDLETNIQGHRCLSTQIRGNRLSREIARLDADIVERSIEPLNSGSVVPADGRLSSRSLLFDYGDSRAFNR